MQDKRILIKVAILAEGRCVIGIADARLSDWNGAQLPGTSLFGSQDHYLHNMSIRAGQVPPMGS